MCDFMISCMQSWVNTSSTELLSLLEEGKKNQLELVSHQPTPLLPIPKCQWVGFLPCHGFVSFFQEQLAKAALLVS